jgi:hypothetical protein
MLVQRWTWGEQGLVEESSLPLIPPGDYNSIVNVHAELELAVSTEIHNGLFQIII